MSLQPDEIDLMEYAGDLMSRMPDKYRDATIGDNVSEEFHDVFPDAGWKIQTAIAVLALSFLSTTTEYGPMGKDGVFRGILGLAQASVEMADEAIKRKGIVE